ncbi:MAG: hypothetical protein II969_07485 [Anaerolineaceae bacterium]|nr:hypothetical protein [bacterium]MBQ4512819.1 hypothetical protein [Anaerolineaceae bacterium]
MTVKDSVKKIVGAERISAMKGVVMHYLCSMRLLPKGKLQLHDKKIRLYKDLSSNGFHVFRGYYDLKYISQDQKKLLAHRLPITAGVNRNTKIDIGFYDLENSEFRKITESSAWCWQQGSRLRWHPLYPDQIIYNDVDRNNNCYCTRIFDIHDGIEKGKIDFPLYDIADDYSYGISINFSRLQRLRPGYGYNFLPDETEKNPIPSQDGVYYVDVQSDTAKLLYTLKELSEEIGVSDNSECYLNHISISPDNKHFIFFLISNVPNVKGWNAVLFVSDTFGNYKILERKDRVSHYCWIDGKKLMVTCHKDDNIEYYCIFDIETGEKEILNIHKLNKDGHPSPLTKDQFITDTYPGINSLQEVLVFSQNCERAKTVLSVYHDYRLRGEKRCDLHPSVENNGRYFSVDSTYKDGKRSILVFKIEEQFNG